MQVTIGERSAKSNLMLEIFPKDTPLPPIVSKLNIIPDSNRLNRGDLLIIQLDVRPFNCQLEWTMNQLEIPPSLTPEMASMNSTTLIMDTTMLTEGMDYTLMLRATHPLLLTQSSFSYTISINIPPVCSCEFVLGMGLAVETNFKYQCTNCKNSESSIFNLIL